MSSMFGHSLDMVKMTEAHGRKYAAADRTICCGPRHIKAPNRKNFGEREANLSAQTVPPVHVLDGSASNLFS
jgi:hypothetical protein